MLGETNKQFSLSRAALSTGGRAKRQIPISNILTTTRTVLVLLPLAGLLFTIIDIKGEEPKTPAPAAIYDLGADFSFEHNPHGVWQYGYSRTKSLASNQFTLCRFADITYAVGFWHPHSDQGGYYPYVAENPTKKLLTDQTKSWALHPGEVAMEASNSGQYSLVRFVAPRVGPYEVRVNFAGIHSRLSTTDVHVLLNDKSLFDAEIEGYGGDPSFHKIVGKNPKASYSGVVHLQKNDILTFAVGYGANKTHYNDTTALQLQIRQRPEGKNHTQP